MENLFYWTGLTFWSVIAVIGWAVFCAVLVGLVCLLVVEGALRLAPAQYAMHWKGANGISYTLPVAHVLVLGRLNIVVGNSNRVMASRDGAA